MNAHRLFLSRRSVTPTKVVALASCLLIAALLLPGGGQVAAQAQEEPPGRLPYDGVFDMPWLDAHAGADAALIESPGSPMAPENVSWSKLTFQSFRNQHD